MSNNQEIKTPPKIKGPGPMGGPHGGKGPVEKHKRCKRNNKKLAKDFLIIK